MPAQHYKPRPEYVPNPNKFDLRTHHFDARGRLKAKNPYRLHVNGGAHYYERPVGSGNLFHENNEPAGRVEYTISAKGQKAKSFDFDAEHIKYTPPLEGDALLQQQLEAERGRAAALEAELEAIRRDAQGKPADTESRGGLGSAFKSWQNRDKDKDKNTEE